MIRLDRILCPADFSPYSFRAADYAVALARHYQGEVHFLHAVPRPLLPDVYPYLPEPVPLDPETRERARVAGACCLVGKQEEPSALLSAIRAAATRLSA